MTVANQTVSEQRDKILQRVLNLRAKSEDLGASEAEMNTAFTMAMKLMEAYSIEEAELALAETEGRIKLEIVTQIMEASALKGRKQRHIVVQCLHAIGQFTETKGVYWRQGPKAGRIEFTGHRPDVELANFLLVVIRDALDREYENYRRGNPAVGYGAKTSFQTAMANRINSRLWDMANERNAERKEAAEKATTAEPVLKIEDARTSSSTSLIVVEIAEQKARETQDAFRAAYPSLSNGSYNTRVTNRNSYHAGAAAGNRVNLGRSISQGSVKGIA